jgi:hypothetical protein
MPARIADGEEPATKMYSHTRPSVAGMRKKHRHGGEAQDHVDHGRQYGHVLATYRE